jgi:hypothetical protein
MILASVQTVTGAKTFNDGTLLLDDSDSAFNLVLQSTSTITTADKTLTFDVDDANRTLTITANTTLSGGTHSGTNTGDQTSIVGITGTKAQFDTACTDGDFIFVGDAPTAHTHLLAAGATDVTATASELNLLDLAGLTAGWVLSADTATTASWKAPVGGAEINDLAGDGISGIADDQLPVGTGAGTASYQTLPNGAVSYATAGGTFSQASAADLTDGIPDSRTITVTGDANEITVAEGAQDLSANRTFTVGIADAPVIPGEYMTVPLKGLSDPTGSDGRLYYNTTGDDLKYAQDTTWRTVVNTNESQTLSNKILTTPTIADFTNAGHDHEDAAGGGTLASAATPTAIHDDTDGEINAVTAKGSPVGADVILIEDSAASFAKKKITISSLPAGGEINDLVGDGISGIADDQLAVGTGSGTAAYTTLPNNAALKYATATNTFSQAGTQHLSDVTITDKGAGEILQINGGGSIFENVTFAEAGLVTPTSTDTFTNKTFDANGTGNSLSNVDVADLANGTDGELITWDATGAPATVAVGAATEVLTSNGPGLPPTFQAPTSGTPTAITVADESIDTTCFVSFFTDATGDLGPKTGSNLTFDSASGLLTATGFVGPLTGQADTVATIAGLAPDTATTQATQAAITSAANLATVGTITAGVWQGTAIADGFIASAATWNGKQDALTFGIGDGNAVDIDAGASITANDYCKFSSTGLIGQTYAEVRTDLGLVIGTHVQAWDADLDTWATKTPPSGDPLGTTDTQSVTNKDLTAETNKLRHSKSVMLEDPADSDRIALYSNERAITILGVSFASEGGTSVLFNLEYGTSIASGTVIHTDTCATSTPEWDVTPSGDATVPTDQIICLEITTVTGTVNQLHITFYYDED